MTGISCLIKNTALQQDVKDLIEYLAYTRVSKNENASLSSIYNDIRKSGIEADLQSVGYLYNEALPKQYQNFQSDLEVNDYILKSYTDAIQRAALLEPTEKEKQIGEDKPEIAVVNGILNMFYNANTDNEQTQTDMRKMQEALWKGVQRKLALPENQKPKTQEDWKDVLNKALGYEKLGITDLNGRLNSISDLYEAMKVQLEDAGKQLLAKGDYATVERWYDMVDQLRATTYGILFSKDEAADLLNGLMKQAGFGKELKNGKTIIDWNKLSGESGSIQQLRDNVDRVLTDNNYPRNVIEGVKTSLENEFNDLQAKMLEYKIKELQKRQDAIGRVVNSKSDLKRLAELNNLGIFNGTHDRLLNHLIGVSDLQAQDIADLKQLAQAASELYRHIDKNYGNDVFGSSAFQALQRNIDSIIARNINNKSGLNRVIAAIKNFFDLYLTSLLMAPLTITENLISGLKEIAAPYLFGKSKLNKEDSKLYFAVLKDVTARGQAFGEEVGSFAPRELYSNTLKYKYDPRHKVKSIAEGLIHTIMLPARVGLLGFDSANKAVITNKTFHNAMFKALTQNGKSKEEAAKILNEALHGQKYEDAKVQAKDILEKTNDTLDEKFKIPVSNATVTRLANDLVKANLNSNGGITNDVIEAALKSSYHVAGYGLGHEPNNILSKGVKGVRDGMATKERELIDGKKWNELAWHRGKSLFVNSMVLRFTGGATNWVYLRAQSGIGVGLLTGFLGKWNSKIDFADKESLQDSIRERQNSRNQIGRALGGIAYTALGYTLKYILTSGGEDEREKAKKRLELLSKKKTHTEKEKAEIEDLKIESNVYKTIKSGYEGNRLFKKIAPDAMLLNYFLDTDRNTFLGTLAYVQNTTGLGNQYSTSAKIQDAADAAVKNDYDAARGSLSTIIGDRMGVPAWRAYKEWGKLFSWIGGGVPSSDFKKPTTFAEGLFGGGALEDLGFYKRDSRITLLPGIGYKTSLKFEEQYGLKTMSDLKKKKGWYDLKDKDSKSGDAYILDKDDRVKAKAAQERYEKSIH